MSALLRRGRGRAKGTSPVETGEVEEAAEETLAEEVEEPDDEEPAPGLSPRPEGPWDVTERSETDGLVDLGAIRLRGRDGMELRLEVDESSGMVTAVTVQVEESAVQLQAFAAPRSEGIWDEIRSEIASGIIRQGGSVDEVPGAFGRELIARIPVRAPNGRSGHQPARFVGIDGPRWFLRAVFHGSAVYEPDAVATTEGIVKDVVVVRGPEAMAPRDLLPLRLPDAVAPAPPGEEPRGGREPLDPFRRGPEITEIR